MAIAHPGVTDLPALAHDPFDDTWLDDAVGFAAAVRETAPVVRLTALDAVAVGRHADVVPVLRNWQDFGSAGGVGLSNFATSKPWRAKSILLEADPPHHDAPHRVLADVLGPRSQQGLRESWAEHADVLVKEVLARGEECDGLRDLAVAFPLRAFGDAMGIGSAGRDRLMAFSDFLFNAFGPRNELVRDGAATAKSNSEWVDANCRREALAPGGLGARIWAAADRGEITEHQAPHVVRSLFAAGVNTTVHALGSLLHALATHPGQWEAVRRDGAARRTALDEAIRWSTPVQWFFRTTTGPTTIGGTSLPRHTKVMVLLGAANRDPRRWENPDAFDVGRDPSGHVGFGIGLHGCLGQSLARLEAEALLDALARHIDTITPAGPAVPRRNNTLRAWHSIPLRLTRA